MPSLSTRGGNRVKLFREINEVMSELIRIRDESNASFGDIIAAKFPQVFVFGNQSCGKSKLLNAMIQLELFPTNSAQCTVRPTFFIREYCDRSQVTEATIEYKTMATEDGIPKVKPVPPQKFNLDEEGGIARLCKLILSLQSIRHVIDLLRVPVLENSSAGEETFKLSNWYDTAIHISVKVPISRCESSSPVEFLQFVDLPGLQVVEPAGLAAGNLDYNELVMDKSTVERILEPDSTKHQEWFTAPWFTYLTLQFLKKPSALGIHCISSQNAQPGNVRSVNVMNKLRVRNLLMCKTVEVWTMVDFHCPKLMDGRDPPQWVQNFRTRKQDLFKDILKSSFFVGAFLSHSRSDYTLIYKCLSNGMGQITKQQLLDEGSQIAQLFAEVDEGFGVFQRLGPIALLEKCVTFIDEGFNDQFVRGVTRDCGDTIVQLNAYMSRMGKEYPLSRFGEKDQRTLHLWVDRVINGMLVWMGAGRDVKGIGNPPNFNGINWTAKVTEFQGINLRHCIKAAENRPNFCSNLQFCTEMDFLAGTFPKWTFADGLIHYEVATFLSTSSSTEERCKTPLDQFWSSLRFNGGETFQTAVSIEATAHNTVQKMLTRLAKNGVARNGENAPGIFNPATDITDHICDDWWYSFKCSVEQLFEQVCTSLMENVSDYMQQGQFYFPEQRQFPADPLFGKPSYKTLYSIVKSNLLEILKKGWKGALEEECQKISRAHMPANASQLTSNEEVLCRICCLPYQRYQKPDENVVSPRFEYVIEAIAGILASWDENQSRAQVSEDAQIRVDSAQSVDLPNFTSLCGSIHQGTSPSDILTAFGAQIMDPSSTYTSARSTRDCIQSLLHVTASLDAERSLFELVPRLEELRKQLSVRVHRFDAGPSVHVTMAVPIVRIVVMEPRFHYIVPSEHYTDVSLRWCLTVNYENWPFTKPRRIIFRSLHDFELLWREMKSLGNIDCGSDSLPRNTTFLGEHRYHHLEFMTSSHGKLQTALNTICDTVARMSSEACKQYLEKWLEFNNSQEMYSDSEILKHKQAQFSDSVCAFWQEVKSCSFQNAKLALSGLEQCNTTAVIYPFVQAVGQVEALKTRICSRRSSDHFVRDEDVFEYYSIMKSLRIWRQDNRKAYDQFMTDMHMKLYGMQSERSHIPTRRNFKLEAQCIASIELAQSFMQSTCFRLYSASFILLENQLGRCLVDTVMQVNSKVRREIDRIYGDIDAKNFSNVLEKYPTLACPVSIENTMRVAAESIEKLRKIARA